MSFTLRFNPFSLAKKKKMSKDIRRSGTWYSVPSGKSIDGGEGEVSRYPLAHAHVGECTTSDTLNNSTTPMISLFKFVHIL